MMEYLESSSFSYSLLLLLETSLSLNALKTDSGDGGSSSSSNVVTSCSCEFRLRFTAFTFALQIFFSFFCFLAAHSFSIASFSGVSVKILVLPFFSPLSRSFSWSCFGVWSYYFRTYKCWWRKFWNVNIVRMGRCLRAIVISNLWRTSCSRSVIIVGICKGISITRRKATLGGILQNHFPFHYQKYWESHRHLELVLVQLAHHFLYLAWGQGKLAPYFRPLKIDQVKKRRWHRWWGYNIVCFSLHDFSVSNVGA